MESLVICIGERRSSVAEIFRGGEDSFCVGRALHNNVVLTDPYVGPEQLRFFRRDGHWYAQPLDTVNPVLLNDEPAEGDEIPLASGDRLTIGRTHIDVFSEDYQVEPARKLLLSSWLYRGRTAMLVALLATFAAAGLDALMDYFEYAQRRSWEGHLNTALSTVALVVVWAGIWALIGKLTRHQGHYSIQLLVTALASGLISLALPLPSFVDYLFSSVTAAELFGYLLALLLLALLLRWNLYYAVHPGRPWFNAFCVAAMCILTYAGVSRLQQPEYSALPRYSASLKPPLGAAPGGVAIDAFLERGDQLAQSLAEDVARDRRANDADQ